MLANIVGTAAVISETFRIQNLAIKRFQEYNQVERTILNQIYESINKTVMTSRIDKETGFVAGTVLDTMSYLFHTYGEISNQSLN